MATHTKTLHRGTHLTKLVSSRYPNRFRTASSVVRQTRGLAAVTNATPRPVDPAHFFPRLGETHRFPDSSSRPQIWNNPNPLPDEFRQYTKSQIGSILSRHAPHLDIASYRAAAEVFPMRVNNYVLENHINWSNVPNDPIFQLTFPQPEMLPAEDLRVMRAAILSGNVSRVALRAQAEAIRAKLNPHPAGQKEENVPMVGGRPVEGMQHKYRETVLFFPMEGQFCHSFCTYCFRWAQFTSVGSEQQFQSKSTTSLQQYLAMHPFVSDVLFTGGDPMVMSSQNLQRYIDPLLQVPSLNTIRIGSKSLAFWPHRYTSSPDALATLQLFSSIVASGKHLTLQAHFSHPQELETPVVKEAIRLIRMTGANIRCQAPLIHHVNDNPRIWADMWSKQTRLGCVPYYMFVERDTGASHYFSVPLHRAYDIFSKAYCTLSGVARTVRGPSMSASPGKVGIVGIEEIAGEKVFILKFFQARNPKWSGRTFFAKFDPKANWLNDLKPAFGASKFFFEDEYREIVARTTEGSSGQLNFE